LKATPAVSDTPALPHQRHKRGTNRETGSRARKNCGGPARTAVIEVKTARALGSLTKAAPTTRNRQGKGVVLKRPRTPSPHRAQQVKNFRRRSGISARDARYARPPSSCHWQGGGGGDEMAATADTVLGPSKLQCIAEAEAAPAVIDTPTLPLIRGRQRDVLLKKKDYQALSSFHYSKVPSVIPVYANRLFKKPQGKRSIRVCLLLKNPQFNSL
jgi:hypothetical protein